MRKRPEPPVLLLLLLPWLLAGCPGAEESFRFSLLLVRDSDCAKGARTQTQLAQTQYAVRLTFVHRRQGALVDAGNLRQFELICDRVLLPDSDSEFLVDTASSGPVIGVRVEVFDKQRNLAYFGENLSLDLWAAEGTVHLRPAGGPSCADPARRLHAFHSATLLPNGQVLLVGGIVADRAGGDNLTRKAEAFANGGVEVYDPATLKFLVATPMQVPGRAFHRAVLLPSPPEGPYKVLLIGGIAPGVEGGPLVRLRATNETRFVPFWISPHESAVPAQAALLTVTPDRSSPRVDYRPLPELPGGMFSELLLTPDARQALFIPGAGQYLATATTVTGFAAGDGGLQARWIELADPPVAGSPVSLEHVRVGHAAVRLCADRFVVVGGTMDGPQSSEPSNVASAFTSGASGGFVNVTPSAAPPLAWHTLTPIGRSDREETLDPSRTALRAGGLELTWDGSEQYRAAVGFAAGQPELQLVQDGTPLAVADRTGAGGYQLSYHHEAIPLHDGRVLITGGNTAGERPDADPYESSQQVAIYALGSDGSLQLDPASRADGLRVARFGHRATRLLDNSVLITGGITLRPGDVPVITTETEVLAPRVGDPTEDFPFDRPAGEARRPCREFGQAAPSPATAGQLVRSLAADQPSSPTSTDTRPEPRTSSGLRIRTVRDATGRLILRIRGGALAR